MSHIFLNLIYSLSHICIEKHFLRLKDAHLYEKIKRGKKEKKEIENSAQQEVILGDNYVVDNLDCNGLLYQRS